MLNMIDSFYDPQFLVMFLTAIAVFATVMTLVMPYMDNRGLNNRMKYVATERDILRAQRRAELSRGTGAVQLRVKPKGYMDDIVKKFNLRKMLEGDQARDRLKMAGLRGQAPLVTFLFARAVLPVLAFGACFFYMFIVRSGDELPIVAKLGVCLGGVYAGFYMPSIIVSNLVQKRQQSIKESWPDALDLLLICVEAGMSIEAAFQRVSKEVSSGSMELAEEMSLTTAELSYLPERRQAYENLGKRTGLAGVKDVMTSLIQAERYGTPLGRSLRVMAQENRDVRMQEAEKKAAALPPKLTVPMIVFFLPVLFVVILGPTVMKVMAKM